MLTHNRHQRLVVALTLLSACLLLAPAARAAANATNFTVTTAEIDTYNTTSVTQQVNTFQVELKARMQGGSYLFDQTYNVAFTDPTVQAAVTQAKNLLTSAGAVSFIGPTQLSSNQSTTSTTNTVQTGKQTTATPTAVGEWVGPVTINVGQLGVCQSYAPAQTGTGLQAPVPNYFQFSGCSLPGQSFTLLAGQIDFDGLTTSFVTISQTKTTTNTTLTSQVYELDGVASGSPPPSTPAPPSLWLAVIGGLALAGYVLWSRRRAVWH
jgi:hypothetical protein